MGPARARVLAERLIEEARGVRDLAVLEYVDLDPLVAQHPEAAPARLRRRVVGGDDDARDSGLGDRLGARWRAAFVRARLERHVEGRAGGVLVTVAERLDLGVRLAGGGVETLADDTVVLDEDGAYERIGTRVSARALRQLERSCEMSRVVRGGRYLRH